jgi:hypothetical protein
MNSSLRVKKFGEKLVMSAPQFLNFQVDLAEPLNEKKTQG